MVPGIELVTTPESERGWGCGRFGGVVKRPIVMEKADWFVTKYTQLISSLTCHKVAFIGSGALPVTAPLGFSCAGHLFRGPSCCLLWRYKRSKLVSRMSFSPFTTEGPWYMYVFIWSKEVCLVIKGMLGSGFFACLWTVLLCKSLGGLVPWVLHLCH